MTRIRNKNRTKVDYRKVWIDAYGPIPVDEQGRPYHIHHIDGDSHNNSLENLKAVSLKEHYGIHLAQQDWAVVQLLGADLQLDADEYLLIKQKAVESLSKAVKTYTGEVFPSLRALHQSGLIKLRIGKNKGNSVGYNALVSITNDPSDLRVEFVSKPKDPNTAAKLISQRELNLLKKNTDFGNRSSVRSKSQVGIDHPKSRRCIIRGTDYVCVREAAEILKVHYTTALRWVTSKTKYLDCYYI
jgi:hypothetical protein